VQLRKAASQRSASITHIISSHAVAEWLTLLLRFRGSWVQTSAQRPANLTAVFRGVSQTFQLMPR
jgi:hypothetical protein